VTRCGGGRDEYLQEVERPICRKDISARDTEGDLCLFTPAILLFKSIQTILFLRS